MTCSHVVPSKSFLFMLALAVFGSWFKAVWRIFTAVAGDIHNTFRRDGCISTIIKKTCKFLIQGFLNRLQRVKFTRHTINQVGSGYTPTSYIGFHFLTLNRPGPSYTYFIGGHVDANYVIPHFRNSSASAEKNGDLDDP